MMKSIFSAMLGAFFGLMGIAAVSLFSAECPSNVLIIMGGLPKEMNAKVYIQDKLIWSGSTMAGAKIRFGMAPAEGQFLVKVDDKEFRRGYVEPADGNDHILAINNNEVNYISVYQGIVEHGRRILACR